MDNQGESSERPIVVRGREKARCSLKELMCQGTLAHSYIQLAVRVDGVIRFFTQLQLIKLHAHDVLQIIDKRQPTLFFSCCCTNFAHGVYFLKACLDVVLNDFDAKSQNLDGYYIM